VLDVGEVAAELEQNANVREPDEGDALVVEHLVGEARESERRGYDAEQHDRTLVGKPW